jgi:hypothetical protein
MVYERVDSWYSGDAMTWGEGAQIQTLLVISWPGDSVALVRYHFKRRYSCSTGRMILPEHSL